MDVSISEFEEPLYTDDDLRRCMELLFYAYRDLIDPPDKILKKHRFQKSEPPFDLVVLATT